MNKFFQIFHNYRQAPWRTQLQMIGLFLAALVVIAIVAAFYVNVTTRTALAGRELSFAKDNIISIQHQISDLESLNASLTSTQNMQERAAAMGFKPAMPEEFTYVFVPGYASKTAIRLAPSATHNSKPLILPEYTESLIDWFAGLGQAR